MTKSPIPKVPIKERGALDQEKNGWARIEDKDEKEVLTGHGEDMMGLEGMIHVQIVVDQVINLSGLDLVSTSPLRQDRDMMIMIDFKSRDIRF